MFTDIAKKIKNCLKCSKNNESDIEYPIKHIVVLMLENRSFDQIFGYRNDFPEPYKVNGVKNCNSKNEQDRIFNLDKDGNKIYQNPIKAFTGDDNSVHDLDATLTCINGIDNKTIGSMDGFVLANQLMIKSDSNIEDTVPASPQEIMGYFPANSFPVFEYIADNFMICDNWFASAPTCTLPNRAFALCGTSDGHINNRSKGDIFQKIIYKCDTIFDRLNDKDKTWKVYFNDVPLSLVLEKQLALKNLKNYSLFENFLKDIENNCLPHFSFIEPEYGIESSAKKILDVNNGQILTSNIIKALQSNKEVWESTLFIVYYDESGGFFDHVYPPNTIPPFSPKIDDKYSFNQYGNRIPAMLISPRISKGVNSTLYDLTSILNFIENIWNIEPLTERDRNANNFKDLILNEIRTDIPMLNIELKMDKINETTIRDKKDDLKFFKTTLDSSFSKFEDGDKILANFKLYKKIYDIANIV